MVAGSLVVLEPLAKAPVVVLHQSPSKITSSWPGGVHCEPPACLDPKQMPTSGRSPPKAPEGKAWLQGSHSGAKQPRNWELEGAGGWCDPVL